MEMASPLVNPTSGFSIPKADEISQQISTSIYDAVQHSCLFKLALELKNKIYEYLV